MVKTTKAGATWALDYERLFERAGRVKQVFSQGSRCYIEFDPRGPNEEDNQRWTYRKTALGKVLAPEIPLSVYLGIRAWSAERRRFRAMRLGPRDERCVVPSCLYRTHGLKRGFSMRDPREFIGGHELEYPFMLRFRRVEASATVRVRFPFALCFLGSSFADSIRVGQLCLSCARPVDGQLQCFDHAVHHRGGRQPDGVADHRH